MTRTLPEIEEIMREAAIHVAGTNATLAMQLFRAADDLLPAVVATVDRAIDEARVFVSVA